MATTVAFSKYVSTEGKADRLRDFIGHDEPITFTHVDGGEDAWFLDGVVDDREEGWLALVSRLGGAEPPATGWLYVSEIASFTVEGE